MCNVTKYFKILKVSEVIQPTYLYIQLKLEHNAQVFPVLGFMILKVNLTVHNATYF